MITIKEFAQALVLYPWCPFGVNLSGYECRRHCIELILLTGTVYLDFIKSQQQKWNWLDIYDYEEAVVYS
jgi:hypothetical protein